MPDGILLNGRFLPFSQLPDADASSGFSDFERDVISFCREWLSGANTFQVQSSGSTGKPKKLTFSRNSLLISASQTQKHFDLRPGHSALLCLSPGFIAGKMMIVRALALDLNLVALEPSENPLLDTEAAIQFAAFTPQQLVAILNNETSRSRMKEISTVIVGGGGINPKTEEELRLFNNKIYHTYGMTETLTHVATRKLSGLDSEQYYSCLEGVNVKLDHRGCLLVQSPVSPGWIATNDVAKLMDDRRFTWLGRYDNVVNSGGIKIFPEEIEEKIGLFLAQRGINNRFFTAGIPDRKLGQKLVLVIEGTINLDNEELLENLKRVLPRYKSPKDVFLCARFVCTPSGKVKRKETMNLILQHD